MEINLHKQATTTPKVRAAIQASGDAGTALAEHFGVTAQTIYKWRKRDSVEDRSHTLHRLQTTLTPTQEPPYRRCRDHDHLASMREGGRACLGQRDRIAFLNASECTRVHVTAHECCFSVSVLMWR